MKFNLAQTINKTLTVATVGAVLSLVTLNANPVKAAGVKVIDFSEFAVGQKVTGETTKSATLSVSGQGETGSPRDLMIFDTFCGGGSATASDCSGGDDDLFFPSSEFNFGNALIISEDNDSTDPDDSRHGGTISFNFNRLVRLEQFGLLDIDESNNVEITTFADTAGTQQIQQFSVQGAGDNETQTVTGFNNTLVQRLDVYLPGSGAVDNIAYEPVPEPLTILGSATALGMGGLLKRQHSRGRKNAKQKE
ncbi:MAG: PEP-CTERM sorting domain-containing protein [Coleofasciculus sp. C2-GNP5-27]